MQFKTSAHQCSTCHMFDILFHWTIATVEQQTSPFLGVYWIAVAPTCWETSWSQIVTNPLFIRRVLQLSDLIQCGSTESAGGRWFTCVFCFTTEVTMLYSFVYIRIANVSEITGVLLNGGNLMLSTCWKQTSLNNKYWANVAIVYIFTARPMSHFLLNTLLSLCLFQTMSCFFYTSFLGLVVAFLLSWVFRSVGGVAGYINLVNEMHKTCKEVQIASLKEGW